MRVTPLILICIYCCFSSQRRVEWGGPQSVPPLRARQQCRNPNDHETPPKMSDDDEGPPKPHHARPSVIVENPFWAKNTTIPKIISSTTTTSATAEGCNTDIHRNVPTSIIEVERLRHHTLSPHSRLKDNLERQKCLRREASDLRRIIKDKVPKTNRPWATSDSHRGGTFICCSRHDTTGGLHPRRHFIPGTAKTRPTVRNLHEESLHYERKQR